jgi:hypothetical protein
VIEFEVRRDDSKMKEVKRAYSGIEQIRAVINGFESATVSPSEFSHASHLTVAAAYLLELPFQEALSRMRDGLRRLLELNGLEGYNETITVFWLLYVMNFIVEAGHGMDQLELTNRLLASCSGSALIKSFFSAELLSSEIARAEWVEPDVKPIPWQTGGNYNI